MPLVARSVGDALPVPRLPGEVRLSRLDNGLTVCLLENRSAPVVTSALFYRAGTRDELPGQGGIAHFLEHLMFKGSAAYGPGEIDRRTQALGGTNNAFTSHDLTAYHFDFAPDRWVEALAIEADRMANLTLDPREVASERQVIVEEIAMYEGEPWDALEQAVQRTLFATHAYGRPVLGTREELAAIGRDELAAFHQRYYRPANAVLVVAGDVGDEALGPIAEAFGGVAGGMPAERPPLAPDAPVGRWRIERAHGEVPRLMMAFPAPGGGTREHAALRLLLGVLAGGRASRLHRTLVDEDQLCVWVSADLSEGLELGHAAIAAELVPDTPPAEAEAAIERELARVRHEPPTAEEIERARRIILADWVFGHERVHHQAIVAGSALTLFDLDHPRRQLGELLAVDRDELVAAARRYLDSERSAVVGWSLPDPAEQADE